MASGKPGAVQSNRSDAAYPILARMLKTRRDNLRETIAALEIFKTGQGELVVDLA
jgi:hypothetical protein